MPAEPALLVPRAETPSPSSPPTSSGSPSSGLTGRSLAILIAFLCFFLAIVIFIYARRHAHTRALARARAPASDTNDRTSARPRPQFHEVRLEHRTPHEDAHRRGIWKSMQPLAARVVEPSHSRRPARRLPQPAERERHTPLGVQAQSLGLAAPGNPLFDYAVMGESWFASGRNINEVPRPPPVPHTRTHAHAHRRREPTMHVAVLIAMPTPASPSPSRAEGSASANAHDHPPQAPHDVALGLARMPWRQREDAAVWNAEGALILA